VLRIDKKGDFGITCFDCLEKLIVYSDGIDTQVLSFDLAELSVTKLTKKICNANNLSSLPPCTWVKVFKPENESSLKIIMISSDLKVSFIDISTLKLEHIADFAKIQSQSQ